MKLIVILSLLLFSTHLKAEDPASLKAFLRNAEVKNVEAVYTGEAMEIYKSNPTLGQSLGEGVVINYHLLEKSEQRLIYAISITDFDKKQDLYLYFKMEDNLWKLSNIRTLMLPKFILDMRDNFTNNPNLLHEIEKQYAQLEEVPEGLASIEDIKYNLNNIILTLKTDEDLKQFLKNRIKEFESIKLALSSSFENANNIAKSMNLNRVSYWNKTEIIDVNIGGILDNSVGYFYVPDGLTQPKMAPSEYIYVEKVIGNWYIYKTT